ncbi:MAG: c-type cytochrome [Acidimicrobiia bacterium]|nr:c-type cytochrome [Acidimicrobiia bacterium]
MGIGAATLAIVAVAVIAWLAFLVRNTRIRHRRDLPPPNLSPYLTDDDLETKRLDRVLLAALVAVAVIAIVMPFYYLNETARQESAAHEFDDIAIERGHEWFVEYQCGNCHGANGGGGGARYVEARSRLETTWAAPAVNDVLYRYTEEEVRYWLVYGRPGTPMPAWGAEGGGPLNTQQIDELIAYLDSIQIPQSEVLAAVDGRVDLELSRLAGADAQVAAVVADQQAAIAALEAIPGQYDAIRDLPRRLESLLTDPATCTDESAALLATSCSGTASDQDRDGLSDATEINLGSLVAQVVAGAPPSDARTAIEKLAFDPTTGFSTSEGATPIADLEGARLLITDLGTIERDLRLAAQNLDVLVATAQAGLDSVLASQEARRYAVDIPALAVEAFDGNVTRAQRAVGLFNAYCARCHTAGFSAGIAFTQEPGSGAMGPSLREGRSVVQFPSIDDHYDFVVKGSTNGVRYGVNGVGRGWMPGFGAMLSSDDIMLIVEYERALR